MHVAGKVYICCDKKSFESFIRFIFCIKVFGIGSFVFFTRHSVEIDAWVLQRTSSHKQRPRQQWWVLEDPDLSFLYSIFVTNHLCYGDIMFGLIFYEFSFGGAKNQAVLSVLSISKKLLCFLFGVIEPEEEAFSSTSNDCCSVDGII